ncbi:MAG: helix-turn-helix domain-containing protein [Calditrichaceae bacterium]|nr:helix-turn-helix domain-containing protein [Calditrichaceae bacterium]
MNNEILFFNTEETAKLLGVNISTIKRWTDSGKLKCTKSAGGHRKFHLPQIAEFLKKRNKENPEIRLLPLQSPDDIELNYRIIKADYVYLIDYVLQQALSVNRNRLLQILKGLYLSQQPLHKIYDLLISPVLIKIGDLWANGMISIPEEHLASIAIKDAIIRLQGIIKLPLPTKGIVMCMTLPDELHDIALKMVDHILEFEGYKVLNSGQNTSLQKIEQIFEDYVPKNLYISSIFVSDAKSTEREFKKICGICLKFGVDVFIGGTGFNRFDYEHPAVKKRLSTFEGMYLYNAR